MVNSNIPYLDNSLPKPLFFTPPNGTLGSEATTLFTVTIPDSISFGSLSALSRFVVHILAPSPNLESFAYLIDSSSSSTTVIGATGPKKKLFNFIK